MNELIADLEDDIPLTEYPQYIERDVLTGEERIVQLRPDETAYEKLGSLFGAEKGNAIIEAIKSVETAIKSFDTFELIKTIEVPAGTYTQSYEVVETFSGYEEVLFEKNEFSTYNPSASYNQPVLMLMAGLSVGISSGGTKTSIARSISTSYYGLLDGLMRYSPDSLLDIEVRGNPTNYTELLNPIIVKVYGRKSITKEVK